MTLCVQCDVCGLHEPIPMASGEPLYLLPDDWHVQPIAGDTRYPKLICHRCLVRP